jgi:hypothetical protein
MCNCDSRCEMDKGRLVATHRQALTSSNGKDHERCVDDDAVAANPLKR